MSFMFFCILFFILGEMWFKIMKTFTMGGKLAKLDNIKGNITLLSKCSVITELVLP